MIYRSGKKYELNFGQNNISHYLKKKSVSLEYNGVKYILSTFDFTFRLKFEYKKRLSTRPTIPTYIPLLAYQSFYFNF